MRDVLAGQRAQFEILMRRYNQRVYRVVRSLADCDADAEDDAQETWLLVYRNLGQWDGRARFSTWISKIAIHRAIRRKNSQRPFVVLEGAAMNLAADSSEPAPETAAVTAQLRRLIEHAISTLPDTLRLVFVLRELEEASGPDVAETLGLTQEAVRVRLHRARNAMRERLDDALTAGARDAFGFAGDRCDRIVASVLARLT